VNHRATSGWLDLYNDTWRLGFETARMMDLRTRTISAGGPAALTEATLMVAEKWHAAAELQLSLLAHSPDLSPLSASQKTVSFYRRKVARNRARLRK
jgi:hypothetical protein